MEAVRRNRVAVRTLFVPTLGVRHEAERVRWRGCYHVSARRPKVVSCAAMEKKRASGNVSGGGDQGSGNGLPAGGEDVPSVGQRRMSSVMGVAAVPADLYEARAPLHKSFTHHAQALTIPNNTSVVDCVEVLRRVNSADEDEPVVHPLPTEFVERLFIVDAHDATLLGHVTMRDLLLAKAASLSVDTLMRPNELVVHIEEALDAVTRKLRALNALIAPVIDDHGKLVGVITAADVIREIEFEATDDLLRYGGVVGGEEAAESYLSTSMRKLFTGRIVWLVVLLMFQSVSSLILGRFQELIERNVVLALFLTMLTGTGGNAGNQSSALVIRGLATGEIQKKNYVQVVGKESMIGVSIALVLGVVSFARVYLTAGSSLLSSLAVSIAVVLTTSLAILGGTITPLLLYELGVDPCFCASPALATLTDITGVLILCWVASMLLG